MCVQSNPTLASQLRAPHAAIYVVVDQPWYRFVSHETRYFYPQCLLRMSDLRAHVRGYVYFTELLRIVLVHVYTQEPKLILPFLSFG